VVKGEFVNSVFTTDYSLLRLHVTSFIAGPLTALTRALSTLSSNFTHVLTVLANDLPTFPTRFTGFITTPLMGYALAVCSAATFTGNTALFFRIHGGKTPV
jgi:ethanolamine transporter EutH